MTYSERAFGPRAVITLYCAFQARELLGTWAYSSYDRSGWIVMLIWSLPILLLPFLRQASSGKQAIIMLPLALILSLVGQVGSLRVLQHAGLAVAMASWVPFSALQTLWTFSALSWMPAFGWIGTRLFFDCIFPARILLATAFAVALITAMTAAGKKRR